MKQLLKSATVLDLIAGRATSPASAAPVVSVCGSDKLLDVIGKMTRAKVLSVPVIGESHKLIGFIDMLDIAKFLIQSLQHTGGKSGESLLSQKQHLSAERIVGRTAASFINCSGMNATLTFPVDASALDVANVFAEGRHRVAVVNRARIDPAAQDKLPPAVGEGELWAICSQSDLTRYLHTRAASGEKEAVEKCGATVDSAAFVIGTEQALDMARDPAVIHVQQDAPVIQAMQKIAATGASALAVVDTDGKVVGNFSPSDLRLLFEARTEETAGETQSQDTEPLSLFLRRVEMPVRDYLKRFSPASLDAVVVTKQDTVQRVMDLLVDRRLHHVFIVAADKQSSTGMGQLEGVVTQTDMCRFLLGLPRAGADKPQLLAAASKQQRTESECEATAQA